MRTILDWLLALAGLALLALALSGLGKDDCPDGKCPPTPSPPPAPTPPPPKKPRWGNTPSVPVGAVVNGPKHTDGTEIDCDYPGDRHKRNTASKGLGLCVFWSIHHAADWQHVEALIEMPVWMTKKGIAGGGYPSKVADLIPRLCQERGVAVPDYLQVESNDLDVLRIACASGRMPCVTYAYSPTGRYGGRRIAHMVNLVHLDDRWAVILDNNHPGYDALEWMSHAEFLRAYSGGQTGWSIIFLDAPPPPPPFNERRSPTRERGICRSPTRLRGESERPLARASGCDSGSSFRKTCPCSPACVCGCNEGRVCLCNGDNPDLAGVSPEKLGKGPRYRRNGREVTKEEALQAMARVPDDRARHRLTVIGSAEDRKRVLDDWAAHPALAAMKHEFVVKSYAPDHWHVARYGFATDGRPTIYVQDSSGEVLLRRDRYDGPEELATTLRRLRPDYDPKKDPQGRLFRTGGRVPASVWLVGGGAILAYLLMRRK